MPDEDAVLRHALLYVSRGFALVAFKERTKFPNYEGWPSDAIKTEEVARQKLNGYRNIGVLFRECRENVTDIDLDHPAALAAAAFLPPTGFTYGRRSNPASHRFYITERRLLTVKFQAEGKTFCEIRSVGAPEKEGGLPTAFQTVLRPSIHPDGETYAFANGSGPSGEIAQVSAGQLWRSAILVAASTLIADAWPPVGVRHHASLALGGMLARRGVTLEEAKTFGNIIASCQALSKQDRKATVTNIATSYQTIEREKRATGLPSLAKLMNERAVQLLDEWLSVLDSPLYSDAGASFSEHVEQAKRSGGELTTSLIIESFDQIEAKPVEWLWDQRIPRDKLTMFCGNPDVGKTTIVIEVIARHTTGRDYPDGAKNTDVAREVLMLIAEDDPADTIKPRLIGAGADVSKVKFVRAVEIRQNAKKVERMLALDTDIGLLEGALMENRKIGLVVIDPITNYLGKADMNREQEVRRVLTPIRELAERVSVTVIGLAHFNKRSDVSALHRVGGASAMGGVPRAVWLFVKDQQDAGLYKMLRGKGNLSKVNKGLKYRIIETITPTGGVPTIEWSGETSENVDDALTVDRDPESRKSTKAKRFLMEHFKSHPGMQPSDPIVEEARRQGISKTTLFRAREDLGVEAERPPGTTKWFWTPPKAET